MPNQQILAIIAIVYRYKRRYLRIKEKVMLTEQEAIAQLNERITKKQLKASTERFLAKLKILEDSLNSSQNQIKDLTNKIRELESEILRTRGAISMLLELAAEEEGLLDNQVTTSESNVQGQ